MKKNTLTIAKDNIIGVNYELALVESATELSETLKSVLKKNKIDYVKYNSYKEDSFDKDKSISKPPTEIYEYQNFFVLERTNGDLVLLDGFRRLLWYKSPSTPILVRFYKEKDLSNQQILTLLVNLNHFKFFSNQSYHERGFSLLLKTVFDVDITGFKSSFDAYLSSNRVKHEYGGSYGEAKGQGKNELIKDRIINKHFINDLKFLQTLSSTKYMCDRHVGALLFELRNKTDKDFDVTQFIKLIEENSVLVKLNESYEKVGTTDGSRSHDIVNKILEMYRNIFTVMEGGEVESSFAEKQKEAKDLVEKLKKDKTLVKLTGNSKAYEIERELDKMIAKGENIEFVCVVHPKEPRESNWRDEKVYNLPHGLLEGVKFLEYTDKHLGMGAKEINIGIEFDGHKCKIWHNRNGYYGYGKKYVTLHMPYGSNNYDVDLFVRMKLETEPKVKKPRELKKFSYSPQGRKEKQTICVLAWTNKEAMELFNEVGVRITESEMKNFVYKAWGDDKEKALKDVDQSKPCVYALTLTEGGNNIDTNIAPIKLK